MKKIILSESDLERIVKRVLKEQELGEDYGNEVPEDAKKVAKDLVGKTVRIFSKARIEAVPRNDISGIYEMTNVSPYVSNDMLKLRFNLTRLTNINGSDIPAQQKKDFNFSTNGSCREGGFNVNSKISITKWGGVVGDFPMKVSDKLSNYLTENFCSTYTKKGTDY